MPAVLRRLMRHSAIQTTMSYYVDLDAADMANQLWKGWGQGNILGNIGHDAAKKAEEAPADESTEALCATHVVTNPL